MNLYFRKIYTKYKNIIFILFYILLIYENFIFQQFEQYNFESGYLRNFRSSPPLVFLGKSVLKICSKFLGEHPCRSVISIKLLCNLIKIKLRHRYSPVNLLHIFKLTFPKNTFGGLLLKFWVQCWPILYCDMLRYRFI